MKNGDLLHLYCRSNFPEKAEELLEEVVEEDSEVIDVLEDNGELFKIILSIVTEDSKRLLKALLNYFEKTQLQEPDTYKCKAAKYELRRILDEECDIFDPDESSEVRSIVKPYITMDIKEEVGNVDRQKIAKLELDFSDKESSVDAVVASEAIEHNTFTLENLRKFNQSNKGNPISDNHSVESFVKEAQSFYESTEAESKESDLLGEHKKVGGVFVSNCQNYDFEYSQI